MPSHGIRSVLNDATLTTITLGIDALSRPAAKTSERRFAYADLAMETTDPDLALVRLAQAGDQRAFEALVVKYQRRIARHVARYVRRASDVEDVVQDTFIRAYRGLGSFRGDSAFYSWLYRIATNVALTAVKRDQNPVLLGDDAPEERADAFEPGVSDNEDPERTMIAKQIAEAVEKAIARLQPTLSEALMLFEVEGKTYPEIAQVLGIPVGTVRTRIFRAREFIAKRLEPVLGPHRSRRW
jgi:RNA polymerase sigma-70 factor (ECF subfamily)